MPKALDVMTPNVAICSPESPLTQVAAIMRERNIGDVVVMDKGKLRGIVTDRDLAIAALTAEHDVRQEPVKKYMTTSVITGEPDWSLDKLSEVMARHQIRRLPIVDADQVVGIVSLGDIATHDTHTSKVAQSLSEISQPATLHRVRNNGSKKPFLALAMIGATAAGVLLFSTTRMGRQLRADWSDAELRDTAMDAVKYARQKLQDPRTRQATLDLMQKTRDNLSELLAQVKVT